MYGCINLLLVQLEKIKYSKIHWSTQNFNVVLIYIYIYIYISHETKQIKCSYENSASNIFIL